MIDRETKYKLHQWILRQLSPTDTAKISSKYPLALKSGFLGIDLEAKIKNIIEVVGDPI